MNTVPNDLEKIKKEIKNSMEIYEMMEEFNYKYSEDDLRRKWDVMGGPKSIIKFIQEQKSSLERDKGRFREKMDSEQDEFKQEIEEIEKTIMNFSQYSNLRDHAAVANIASDLNDRLKEFTERAKKFNL
jgi:dynein heavy chain